MPHLHMKLRSIERFRKRQDLAPELGLSQGTVSGCRRPWFCRHARRRGRRKHCYGNTEGQAVRLCIPHFLFATSLLLAMQTSELWRAALPRLAFRNAIVTAPSA